ncbi:LPS export ABC transporter periplasmic protein LptC [Lysobacter pythonis]|uniref:LPS export ABC transporter periplasmic protein LptC n=1 Tax=Solilutibacter pythonis TaxID=2483112 RepID=A0A3M2I4F9_9GAMM|nr:LPS export ABC transporter periplasmic protein LptC [Lysobacter pythonis]RMH94112.1 LPS export ABC transporter periplasmic protein LptC [Lysobacter pythonis]
MNWRGWLTLALLLASIAGGIAILRQQKQLRGDGQAEARPDYVLHDFEIVTLKKDGSEGFTLRAPELARNPDNREMDIRTPTFLFPDKHGSRWRSQSRTAWVNAEGSEVRLRGDVRLDNPGGVNRTRLETASLDVFPDAERATSQDEVVVTQPGSIIRGRGLEAQLDQNRVTLKSEVRARYAPSIQ